MIIYEMSSGWKSTNHKQESLTSRMVWVGRVGMCSKWRRGRGGTGGGGVQPPFFSSLLSESKQPVKRKGSPPTSSPHSEGVFTCLWVSTSGSTHDSTWAAPPPPCPPPRSLPGGGGDDHPHLNPSELPYKPRSFLLWGAFFFCSTSVPPDTSVPAVGV